MILAIPKPVPADAIKTIDLAIDLILRKDGDRDHMNHSDLTCLQSMAVVDILRACRGILQDISELTA